MGEGGCDPAYFFERMGVQEARDYIAGQDRRHRQHWEQTRMLARLMVKVHTGKDWDISFPWDMEEERNEKEPATEEEMAALRERAKQMEAWMNRNKR